MIRKSIYITLIILFVLGCLAKWLFTTDKVLWLFVTLFIAALVYELFNFLNK